MDPVLPVRALATRLSIEFQKFVGKDVERDPSHVMPRIRSAMEQSGKIVFGEVHGNYSHAEFVSAFMPFARAAGADRLYVEMFHQRNQKYIDAWQDGGDAGSIIWLMNRSPSFSVHMWQHFWNVLQAAHDNGLRIVTIEPDRKESVYPGMEIFYRNMMWENAIDADQKIKGGKAPYVVYCGAWHLDRSRCAGASPLHEMMKSAGVVLENGRYSLILPRRQAAAARMYVPTSPYQTPICLWPQLRGAQIQHTPS